MANGGSPFRPLHDDLDPDFGCARVRCTSVKSPDDQRDLTGCTFTTAQPDKAAWSAADAYAAPGLIDFSRDGNGGRRGLWPSETGDYLLFWI